MLQLARIGMSDLNLLDSKIYFDTASHNFKIVIFYDNTL